ncbi:MAG: IclR family transcriptional regulator [Acidimicrobiaceae bacterium]|nr:IclR family transcriptional regulator [Acidimicrobiaceae bacterium]
MTEDAEVEAADRYRVKSVQRALRLVELIADAAPNGLTVTELARQLKTSKSTAFALAQTMLANGYLRDVQPGPRYQLGLAFLRLGDLVSRQIPLGDTYRPVLVQLTEATGLTSRAAISEDGYPVFIERVDGPGTVRFHTLLGHREAPHASAAGKAILSTLPTTDVERICGAHGLPRHTRNTITEVPILLDDLERTRRRGFSIDDEEDAEGIFCIAAPFFDHSQRCVGAISVTGIKIDVPSWKMQEFGHLVADHARILTSRFNGQAPTLHLTSNPRIQNLVDEVSN